MYSCYRIILTHDVVYVTFMCEIYAGGLYLWPMHGHPYPDCQTSSTAGWLD